MRAPLTRNLQICEDSICGYLMLILSEHVVTYNLSKIEGV